MVFGVGGDVVVAVDGDGVGEGLEEVDVGEGVAEGYCVLEVEF